jgi:hypothetical protein
MFNITVTKQFNKSKTMKTSTLNVSKKTISNLSEVKSSNAKLTTSINDTWSTAF